METAVIKMDRAAARELYQAYKAHLHYSEPVDQEIMWLVVAAWDLTEVERTALQARLPA